MAIRNLVCILWGMVNKMYFYGIFDKNDDCLYVGKTVNPKDAKTRHKTNQSWREEIHYFKILAIEDDKEMGLIDEYQTKYNKERYTGGVSKYDVGDIFGHIDDSKNTYPRKKNYNPRLVTLGKPIRHKLTGVVYKSGYAVWKAGLCRYPPTNILNTCPNHHFHDIFEFVD